MLQVPSVMTALRAQYPSVLLVVPAQDPSVLLVSRRHVDLGRLASALCS